MVNAQYGSDSLFRKNIKQAIRVQVDSILLPEQVIVDDECLSSPDAVWEYYMKNDYTPVWYGTHTLSPLADTMLAIIKTCYSDGLQPGYYHYRIIDSCIKNRLPLWVENKNYEALANLDMLLTDAFITYSTDQYAGFIHNEEDNVDYEEHVGQISPADSLQKAITQRQLRNILSHFTCIQQQYVKLKKSLALYRELKNKGGWDTIPIKTHLKKGDTGEVITLLQNRLFAEGYSKALPLNAQPLTYNAPLVEGVKKFQQRHGLDTDGVVGKTVVTAMNISVDSRIEQIALNMERWRWLPHTMPQPYIMVNIAGFHLNLVDSNKTVLGMKIIVGKPYTQTPLFHARMTYLILNPWWEVPTKIARKEIVPDIKRNRAYINRNHMKFYSSWGKDAYEIPADSIKWDSIHANSFPYRVRQMPGAGNALGRIKFMFPNKYDVYLHDTPQRNLFNRTVRTFSHGCIRIEKPVEMATYLLNDDNNWTQDSILSVINSGAQQTITLPHPVDVYICYWTSWVNSAGQTCFRRDIYGDDEHLLDFLQTPNECVKF